jgi:mRNA interferase RelE/StbE
VSSEAGLSVAYAVQLTSAAVKQLDALPDDIRTRILPQLWALAEDPRPAGCKKLKGTRHSYRIRVGNYRVLYEVHDARVVVIVFKIGHRSDVYG